MPQIFVMLSPRAQERLADKAALFFAATDKLVTDCIVHLWKVPQEDVAASAVNLAYARGEADVQIEIRYTAGEDEYDTGAPFDPSLDNQQALIVAILGLMSKHRFSNGLTFSVWCKPYRKSLFKMGASLGAPEAA